MLMNRLSTQICRYLMHHYARVNAGHLFVGPSEHITKFMKKIDVELKFLWSASDSNVNVLNNPWFNKDIDWLSLHNVPHVSFRKNLMNLDGCLKGLRGEIGSKLLKASKHFLVGREK